MTLGLTTLNSWEFGYQMVGGFQIALGVCFGLTLSMWSHGSVTPDRGAERRLTEYKTPMRETLRLPHVWFSVGLFFLYVGAESSLGIWIFTLLTESRGVEEALAGFLAGSYWLTFTIGRIVAGGIAGRIGGDTLVLGGLVGALLGAGVLIWNPSEIANVFAVALIGLSIAPIFPAMMSSTRRRVGARYAANTIGIQMAATGLGMAVIPGLMGVLARQMSLEVIPACLLAVYAGLLGFHLLAMRFREAQAV
jgi:fucose permease